MAYESHRVMSRCAISAILVLVACAWIVSNEHQGVVRIEAQESPKKRPSDEQAPLIPAEKEAFEFTTARPFPVFYVGDVVARLKTATDELIEKKLVKNSGKLREHLERTQFTTRLPRSSSKEISPQESYRKVIESVFLVAGMTRPKEDESTWQTAFATAFCVHEDGILSTSAHVFDHDDRDDAVVVLDVRGRVFPVLELLAVDRQADTCLFRIDRKGLKPLPLGNDIPPGSAVRVMGHPGDSFFFFSTGNIANYERDEDGLVWLNVTADFGQGSSGGPVMDGSGNVVGQVSRTFTLYAGDNSSSRRHRPRTRRQSNDTDAKVVPKKDEPADDTPIDKHEASKSQDPQMIFKACTPVSAIHALVK